MASPDEQTVAMIARLEKNTGRSLDDWVAIARASGFEKHGEIVKYLKSEHGLTHGYANLVTHEHRSSSASHADSGDLVTVQYTGKEALRPVYDRIVEEVVGFGADVELAPKKAYVSLRRKKQFGLVQPSTRTRVDLGVQLPGVVPHGRLEASGSFNTMVSHRVRLGSPEEVDEEVVDWLRRAYEEAG